MAGGAAGEISYWQITRRDLAAHVTQGGAMPVPQELQPLAQQLQQLQTQLGQISEADWATYKRVRDILTAARTLAVDTAAPPAAAAAGGVAEGAYIMHPMSHACAMQGIFEPAEGQDTSTEYDAAAVERFAALGG